MRRAARKAAAWGQQSVSGSDHYAGQLYSDKELRRRAKKATDAGYFGSQTAHYGSYHVAKDYAATIDKRWHDISKQDKQWLFGVGMATTFVCAAAAALVSGIPDSTDEPVTVMGADLNWLVDPVANALFIVFMLPLLKLVFRNLYADKHVLDQAMRERPVLLHSTENPRENIKQWAQVKYDRGQFDFIKDPEDAAIKAQWLMRKEVTRGNMSQYVAMGARQFYNKSLTRVILLTMIPYLAKVLPGSSAEHTGDYKYVNFLYELLLSFTVLVLHGVISKYMVGPGARGLGVVAYGGYCLMKPCLDRCGHPDDTGEGVDEVRRLERGELSPDADMLLGDTDGMRLLEANVPYHRVGDSDHQSTAVGLADFSMGSSSEDDEEGEISSTDKADTTGTGQSSPSPFV